MNTKKEGPFMKLDIAICDNQPEEIQTLTRMIRQFQFDRNHNITVDTYSDGNHLLKEYQKPGKYHILFLDIEMPGHNGIETAIKIRNKGDRKTKIIFVSDSLKYMQNSFSVHPFHYLQKPITEGMIMDILTQIIAEFEEQQILYSVIDHAGQETPIMVNEIQYIDVINSKTKELCFHFPKNTITTRGTLRQWNGLLEDHNFFLCRRDILINLLAIHYFSDANIILHSGESVPISRKYRKLIRDQYLNRIIVSCTN